jgi:ArsR family transcriptional regulator
LRHADQHARPDVLLGWMGSLADPTRLRLLQLLERHELGVVELCDVLQMPQSTVSRHLKVLADEKWVGSRRHGTARLYHMILDELTAPQRKLWLLIREQTVSWSTSQQDQLRLTRVLRDRETDSESFFAGAASEWDKLRRELYGERFTTEAVLSLLPRDMIVADLGCGSGQVAATLASHVKQVIGVDNSPAMLKAARKRTAGLKNVDLRRGSVDSLPMGDGSIDAALMLLVLTYLEQPDSALREAARVLKPKGRLIIVDLLPHDRDDFRRHTGQVSLGFAPEDLTARLTASGLTDVTVTPLPPEPAAKGPALLLATAVHP